MDTTINLTVNGQRRTITTDPLRLLLHVIREDLQLTGTKYGCGESDCGACTVLLNGRAVRSCRTRVGSVGDKSIQTIEGLATGDKLHPVQEAFLAENAYQCGYCIPGYIMSLVSILNERPIPTDAEIMSRMDEHLCRCCGYPNLLKAIRRAAAQARS